MQFHDQRFDFYQYKMIQYNKLTVKLSNSHLSKLKSAIKNEMGVVLRLSSDMVGDDETNFPHKLLSTNREVENLCKAFGNKYQLMLSYQKLNYLRWYYQGRFLVDLLVHY